MKRFLLYFAGILILIGLIRIVPDNQRLNALLILSGLYILTAVWLEVMNSIYKF